MWHLPNQTEKDGYNKESKCIWYMVVGVWSLEFGFRIGEMECKSSWTSIEVIEKERRTSCCQSNETDKKGVIPGGKNNSVSGKSLLGAHKGKMKEGEAHSDL